MKRLFKVLGIMILAVLIGFSMIACGDDNPEDNPKDSLLIWKDYIGVWSSDLFIYEISASNLKWINKNNNSVYYVASITSADVVLNIDDKTKDDYPSGYKFSVKITAGDNNFQQLIGYSNSDTFFLCNDKKSLADYGSRIYNK